MSVSPSLRTRRATGIVLRSSALASSKRSRLRRIDAQLLPSYKADGATLDDLRESVTTLEDSERTTRRVFGGAHPLTTGIEGDLRDARAALRAREETPPAEAWAEEVD